ncbi:MAG: acetyl-CoA carboxylase biotin carboxyl carrier protein [Candidatus Limnocylindrales bacterium]
MAPADDHRNETSRARDHAAIDRLADELLPALVAKLGASRLGEIEVREGPWKVRLRAPVGTGHGSGSGTGHGTGHGTASGSATPSGARDRRTPVGPGHPRPAGDPSDGSRRAVATSPGVGIFQPRPEMRPGMRVRAGDRLGDVDVLGVLQEVVSPVDGMVGGTLVDAGDAVEYGQELIRVEAGT